MEPEDSRRSTSSDTTHSLQSRATLPRMSMKKKASIINHTIEGFVFLCFACFVFIPWAKMRDDWKKELKGYSRRNIKQKGKEIKTITEVLLTKYLHAANLLTRAALNTVFIDFGTKHIINLINFVDNFRNSVYPKPQASFLYANNRSTYFIYWDKNDAKSHNLISIVRLENGSYFTKLFENDEIYDGFDQNTSGKLLEEINWSDFKVPYFYNTNEPDWAYAPIIKEKPRSMTSFLRIPSKTNKSFNAAAGFQLDLDDLASFMKNYASMNKCQYLFTDINFRVLFGSHDFMNTSEVFPEGKYPFINQTGSVFWNTIADQITNDSLIDELMDIKFNGHDFVSLVIPISTCNRSLHYFLTACDTSEIVFESYESTSQHFVIYLALIMISGFIALYLGRLIENKKEKELISLTNSPDLSTHLNAGVLYKTIQKIHKLELNYPDEIILNRTLDECVNKIASQHLHPFSCNVDCPFCKELVPEEHEILPDDPEPCFTMWKNRFATKLATYKNVGDLRFQWGMHKENPAKHLIHQFFTIMHTQDLYFPEIDPVCVLQLISDFANYYCMNSVLTSLQINAVCYLMHTQFKYWASNKADLFALYFAALFINADFQSIQEKVIDFRKKKGKFDAQEKYERHQTVIGNSDLLIGYQYEIIIEFVQCYIPGLTVTTKFTNHFIWLFKSFLDCRSYSNYFAMFGKFRLLIESPHFSPMEKMLDRRDFLSVILIFANTVPYWSPVSFCDEAARTHSKISGIDTSDNLQFAKMCIIVEKTLINPIIEILTKFISLDSIVKNQNAAISMWEKTIEACLENDEK